MAKIEQLSVYPERKLVLVSNPCVVGVVMSCLFVLNLSHVRLV